MSVELAEYLRNVAKLEKFRRMLEAVRAGSRLAVGGVYGSSYALLAAALEQQLSGAVLLVVDRQGRAEEAMDDFSNFLSHKKLTLFPAPDLFAEEGDHTSHHLRLSLLSRFLFDGPPRLVVAPVDAVATPVWPRKALEKNCLLLRSGQDLDLGATERWLEERGLRRVPLAEAPGEWSRRGSVLDIFPFSALAPCRLELFGDTVESMREYDPATQASTRTLRRCRVIAIRPGRAYRNAGGSTPTLLDYLPADSAVLLLEPDRLEARVNEVFQKTADAKMPLLYESFASDDGPPGRLLLTPFPKPADADGVDLSLRSVERFSDLAGSRSAHLASLAQKKNRRPS